MICEKCKKNEATAHLKTIINGAISESHLCEECVNSSGLIHYWGGLGLSVDKLVGPFIPGLQSEKSTSALTTPLRCSQCGVSFGDIARMGKIGCAQCYDTFDIRLTPMIQRIHGFTKHNGKKPGEYPQKNQLNMLEEKKKCLEKEVSLQNFENAAVLRDEIKQLEREATEND